MLKLHFEEREVQLNFEERKLQLHFPETQMVTTSDHSKLLNRDKPDQHPIKSISGLEVELENKLEDGDYISNQDIMDIINS